VKVGGRLSCSDHEMVEFRILRGGIRAISRIKTLDLRRADFALFKELLGGIPWDRALEGRGAHECWSLFKQHFLHAQKQCIPLRKKSSKGDRTPAWLNKELLAEIGGRERSVECGKRGRPLGKSTGTWSERAGMRRGRPRPTWN